MTGAVDTSTDSVYLRLGSLCVYTVPVEETKGQFLTIACVFNTSGLKKQSYYFSAGLLDGVCFEQTVPNVGQVDKPKRDLKTWVCLSNKQINGAFEATWANVRHGSRAGILKCEISIESVYK